MKNHSDTHMPPWDPKVLFRQIIDAGTNKTSHPDNHCQKAILDGALFHLDLLEHHLQHPLFPAQNLEGDEPVPIPFKATAPRYLDTMIVSSQEQPRAGGDRQPALNALCPTEPCGKPVMSQSALHGFHVFEGLQLVLRQQGSQPSMGFTFAKAKVAKLVDGIIRLRFAVHLLKVSALVAQLKAAGHPQAGALQERFQQVIQQNLPLRRSQAENHVFQALANFARANRSEMFAELQIDPSACFYVRIEALGGNRQSIGQGPLGVGQSTLQILGQHARKNNTAIDVVINPDAPPRLHALTGPFTNGLLFPVLNNRAVHHGNMGHQHLASELAQPHGSDMLMTTAEIDDRGRVQGPFIAETNFSNIGFVINGEFFFPQNSSATYGLTQHIVRQALTEHLKNGLDGIRSYTYQPLELAWFLRKLAEGHITGAFVMGSMPGIRPVANIHLDKTLSFGGFKTYTLSPHSQIMETLINLYNKADEASIRWL